jgi:phosphopantothenoylcysteine decarboxylase/phosphopantothenate--cysteine ligase
MHVESAAQMSAAVEQALPADVFIGVAAVADWRVVQADHKIKKEPGASAPVFTLVENPDILASVAKSQKRPALVIGFAAETQNLIDSGRKKLIAKGCDMIIANDVGEGSEVFGGANNEAHVIMRDSLQSWPKMDKMMLATKLVELIAQRLSPEGANR